MSELNLTMNANLAVSAGTNMPNTISLNANSTEMLRVAEDGFYVRGVKIEQDEKEAEKVYNAFHQWLMWSTLNRSY